jgi:hypothetical protein
LRENKSDRLARLEPVVEQLVTAAQQLELGTEDVLRIVRSRMERQQQGDRK